MCKVFQIIVHVIAIYSLLWGVNVATAPMVQAYQEKLAEQEVHSPPKGYDVVCDGNECRLVKKGATKGPKEPEKTPIEPEPLMLWDWASSFDGAIADGKKLNRPVVVVWTMTGCGPCDYLKRVTLKDRDLEKLLAEKYVTVVLRDSPRAGQYGVSRYPRVSMIMPNGKWKTESPGKGPIAFRSMLIKLSILLH